jgi:peptidyl-tRNA hydrolase, PTH1 family
VALATLRKSPGEPVDLLVVGLGNPGSGYVRTRHNIGYRIVDELARRHRSPRLRRNYYGVYAAADIGGRRVGLLQPTTYMNVSGKSVAAALRALKLGCSALLVAHDEIDLDFGRLQLRHDGGHGGHNGLRSVHELVGKEFDRLRLGVGRPGSTHPDVVADYVLGVFSEPAAEVNLLVERAADAAEAWVRDGLDAAMTTVNAPPA